MFNPTKCLTFVRGCENRTKIIAVSKYCTTTTARAASKYDVVIFGAGCMGTLTAFWLKKIAGSALKVLVVDRDLTYKSASTVLSVGGVRQQFTVEENVQLSSFGADFVQNTKKYVGKDVDVQFKPHGYLTLATENGVECLKQAHETQKCNGGVNKLLNASELKGIFPWLNTDDIKLGCLGEKKEGWMDPWLYLLAMKDAAKELGVTFLEAVPCEFTHRVVKADRPKNTGSYFSPEVRVLNDVVLKTSSGETRRIEFKTCVLATGCETGAFTKQLLDIDRCKPGALQYEVPIERRKRYVYFLECPHKDHKFGSPKIVDPSGLYIRKENPQYNYICGISPTEEDEPSTSDLEVDYEYFENKMWNLLAHRIPSFEACKVKSAWAGFYDYNVLDQNGIIGYHPAYQNMIIAAGFSGHGLQQSPGVGRAVSELLLHGSFQTINLSRFGFERVIKNEPLVELDII